MSLEQADSGVSALSLSVERGESSKTRARARARETLTHPLRVSVPVSQSVSVRDDAGARASASLDARPAVTSDSKSESHADQTGLSFHTDSRFLLSFSLSLDSVRRRLRLNASLLVCWFDHTHFWERILYPRRAGSRGSSSCGAYHKAQSTKQPMHPCSTYMPCRSR